MQQIWTRSRSGPPQESHPHHPAPARPHHRADPGSRVIALGEKGSVKVIRRAVMRARGAGSTMCIVVMLFCLDHLCSIGLLACDGTIRVLLNHSRSVGPPGWSRTPRVRNAHLGVRGVRGPAPQSARSSGNPRARASSRRSRGLSDVLAVRRRHDMRESVPPCKTIGGVERGGRTVSDAVRPRRPTLPIPPRLALSRAPERDSSGPLRTTPRITPGKRTRTPPEQLYGRGGRVRADRPPQPSCSTS